MGGFEPGSISQSNSITHVPPAWGWLQPDDPLSPETSSAGDTGPAYSRRNAVESWSGATTSIGRFPAAPRAAELPSRAEAGSGRCGKSWFLRRSRRGSPDRLHTVDQSVPNPLKLWEDFSPASCLKSGERLRAAEAYSAAD